MALKPDASSVHNDVSPPVAASTPAAPSSDVTTAPLKASIISVKVPALPLSPPLEDDDDNNNDNGNDEEGGNNSDSDGSGSGGGGGGVIASHAHETLLLEAMEAQGSNRGVVLPCDSPNGRGDDSRVASPSVTTPSSSNGDLLPTTVTPTHYDIHLRPDLATGIVSGSVSVDARINEATDKIVLHAKCITITRVVVYHGGSQLCCVGGDSVVYDNSELEMATIQMPCALQPTKAGDCVQIIITFSGV
ncbi:Aminopeptidase 2 mitochondrial, partial [Coemansia sp. RSA 2681]